MMSYLCERRRIREESSANRLVNLPSSKTKSASFAILTKPWLRASARTACVDTTICTSFKAASQIRCWLHRSTLSEPTSSLVLTAGSCKEITPCCCVHKATVGARNQTNCSTNTRLSIWRRDAGHHTFSGGQRSSSAMIRRTALHDFDQRQQSLDDGWEETRSDHNK
jgi:hypothetical protein